MWTHLLTLECFESCVRVLLMARLALQALPKTAAGWRSAGRQGVHGAGSAWAVCWPLSQGAPRQLFCCLPWLCWSWLRPRGFVWSCPSRIRFNQEVTVPPSSRSKDCWLSAACSLMQFCATCWNVVNLRAHGSKESRWLCAAGAKWLCALQSSHCTGRAFFRSWNINDCGLI